MGSDIDKGRVDFLHGGRGVHRRGERDGVVWQRESVNGAKVETKAGEDMVVCYWSEGR